MRLYVPLTIERLAAAHSAGKFEAPLTVYAVTPALREWYAAGDEEELEYAAMAQAARASIGLIAADPGAVRRRVVAACEVAALPPAGGDRELGDARVNLAEPIPWSAVAAVHVDAAQTSGLVAEAADQWEAAQRGDEDAVFAVDACEGEDLLWYATQEVPDLLAEAGHGAG
jgi:hypothetical protein